MYREDIILPLVRNKKVLDCGGIDHWAFDLKQSRGDWLHALVAEQASSCLGVDILQEHVDTINRQGRYSFIAANVEQLPFEEEFDVVLAGEIVEHIYNMGLFLDSAWRALRPNGLLIITTPNSYALSPLLMGMIRGRELTHPEHTCYYSPMTLAYVISKHGFAVENQYLVGRAARFGVVERMRHIVSRVRPILSEKLVLIGRRLPVQGKYEEKW